MSNDISETERIMFAYLAGLGSPEWRREMKAIYAAMHTKHVDERFSDCAECELRHIAGVMDGSSFWNGISKKPFKGAQYFQPMSLTFQHGFTASTQPKQKPRKKK